MNKREELVNKSIKLINEIYMGFKEIDENFYGQERIDTRQREQKHYKNRIDSLEEDFKDVWTNDIRRILNSAIDNAAYNSSSGRKELKDSLRDLL